MDSVTDHSNEGAHLTHRDETPDESFSPKRPPSVDEKPVAEAVRELNIARKSIAMYPPSHKQVQDSLDRAHGTLRRLLKQRDVVFGAAKDRLLLDSRELDRKNPLFAEFAASLSRREVAGVTFSPGLERKELFTFLEILSRHPEDIESRGGIKKAVSRKRALKHIRLRPIDYSKIHYTEETRIHSGTKETTDKVWEDFVKRLVADENHVGGQDPAIRDLNRLTVEELAALINDYKLDIKPAAAYYESVVSEYLHQPAEEEETPREDRFEFLVRFNALLKSIRPELRRQFLDANLRQCSQADTASRVKTLLGNFPDDMIIEILNQTNETGAAISPSLMRLIEAISKTREIDVNQRAPKPSEGLEGQKPADQLTGKDASALFNREDYDVYVAPDYHKTLEFFADSLDKPSDQESNVFPIDAYVKTLEDDGVEYQIARALLAIMDEEIAPGEYRDCARRLLMALEPLLQQERFSFLSLMLSTLKRHSRDKSSPDIRKLAGRVLQSFHAQPFVSTALTYLKAENEETAKKASEFVLGLGSAAVPNLVRMYCLTRNDAEEELSFDLLLRIGPKVVPEARRRLQDIDAPFVHRLVKLLCRVGGQDIVQELKGLKHHENPEVLKQIVGGLLRFKDPEGIGMLRELLQIRENDVRLGAIALAGTHRVQEVTEDLLKMMNTTPFFASQFEQNEAIIEALGHIGDVRAIPQLEKLARARWIINQKRLRLMKETVYHSLSGYPYECIGNLVRMGRKANNRTIQKACMKLAARNAP